MKIHSSIARSLVAFLAPFVGGLGLGCAGLVASDPVARDPSPFDADHPPRLVETAFEVADAKLNAIVYEAQGAGPHPTVILLHGFPGNERNLDLAQALRRAGWNVVFFHYRGAWGSGGAFSFGHVLEDSAAVVEAVRHPEFARAHRVDAGRIALVGHSMGGMAALITGGEVEGVDCVVSLAGGNLGAIGRGLQASPKEAAQVEARLASDSGPIRGADGEALVGELIADADRFDPTRQAEALASKSVLLVVAARDEVAPPAIHHQPMVEALRAAGAKSLATAVFAESDHAFSGQRVALARRVSDWLDDSCRAVD